MKKLKFLGVFAIILLCSGCMKYSVGMTIDENKNVNFELIYALDKEVWGDMLDESEITETDDEMIESGYDVKPYTNGNWIGSIYTKNMGNLDDISTTDVINVDLSNIFDTDENTEETKYYFQKIVDGKKTTYVASFSIDATEDDDSDDSDDNEEEMDMSAFTSSMELTYSVTLPVKADSNNATTVSEDGKTLTWNLEYGKVTNINYQFSFGSNDVTNNNASTNNSNNSNNTTLYIVIGCAGAVVIGTVAVLLINNKKKKNVTTL